MNILTLHNNCYVILTTYMLDSDLEPSYNLLKNLVLLPWILKLIGDMINDSTPLLMLHFGTELRYEKTDTHIKRLHYQMHFYVKSLRDFIPIQYSSVSVNNHTYIITGIS